jgi:hypothetical protein
MEIDGTAKAGAQASERKRGIGTMKSKKNNLNIYLLIIIKNEFS